MSVSLEKKIDHKHPQIRKWVHSLGGFFAEAALDAPCRFFHTPSIQGTIGYRLNSNWVVVFGDPICAQKDTSILTEAFHEDCQKKGLNIAYLVTSQPFTEWIIKKHCKVMIEVGEELVFNPQNDPKEGHAANKLRNTINHAKHLGLNVNEYLDHDTTVEQSILAVGEAWLKSRNGPQIHLGTLNFFDNRTNRRWFYVQDKQNNIIAMALLSRLEPQQGWLLKFLISKPGTPRGTSELLMISILETLRAENCSYLTIGFVPGSRLGQILGLGSISSWLARTAFKMTKWIFQLDKRKAYWNKFRPTTKPNYVILEKSNLGIREILTILKSLKIEM